MTPLHCSPQTSTAGIAPIVPFSSPMISTANTPTSVYMPQGHQVGFNPQAPASADSWSSLKPGASTKTRKCLDPKNSITSYSTCETFTDMMKVFEERIDKMLDYAFEKLTVDIASDIVES